MRVLLDSNVYITYLLNPSGSTAFIFAPETLSKMTLLLPRQLLSEFLEKIETKDYLIERINRHQLRQFLDVLDVFGEKVAPIEQEIPSVSRDPKDDFLLAYAVLGRADYLVTNDKDLLVLEKIDEMKIVTVHQFFQIGRA